MVDMGAINNRNNIPYVDMCVLYSKNKIKVRKMLKNLDDCSKNQNYLQYIRLFIDKELTHRVKN